LIRDLQPFTVVDNPSYRTYISALNPRYTIPDRHKAKGAVHLIFYLFFDDNNI
jgi:hypothetical protein